MTISATMLDAMVEAGLSPEQMAKVLKADIAALEARREARRAGAADRQRRKRERDHAASRSVTRDMPLRCVTARDTPSPNDAETYPSTVENNLNPTPPIAPPSPWPKTGFQQFYELYPRKVARGAAEKAFAKAKGYSGLTFERLMSGLAAYIASNPNPEFIPHPASWLNGQRWDDEITVKVNGSPHNPLPTTGSTSQGKVYAKQDSPQWHRWNDHLKATRGRGAMTDRAGGWWFESEWPPPDPLTELRSAARITETATVGE